MKQAWAVLTLIFLLIFTGSSFGEDPPAPEAKKPAKKNKFQMSELTYDESEGTSDRRSLRLATGEDKTVDLDFDFESSDRTVVVSNPTVVKTTLVKSKDKRQLVFSPLKAGDTTVVVRDNEGTIRVIFQVRVNGSNLLRIAGEVRQLLRDVEGINIRIVGPKVVVDGEVIVPADYGRLLTVIQDKSYADFVLNMAELSPLTMKVVARKIQDDINVFAPEVKTRVVNGMILLEGTVNSKPDSDRAARVADLYLPDLRPGSFLEKDPSVVRHPPRSLIHNLILINPRPPAKAEKLVRVNVHFVELTKDYNRVFNFKWQPAYTEAMQLQIGQAQNGAVGAAAGAGNAFSFGATISSLLPKLDSWQRAGYARILKTGVIVVRSGQPAKLVEQTQIPMTITSPNGQASSANTAVGLTMAVTPLILGQSEDIQMQLDLDQSNVIGRENANGSVRTAGHKISTSVYIKSNESAAVGGLTGDVIATNFNKDPPYEGRFDGQTAPIFTLMRSKNFQKNRGQFVVFVTPQIIENASDGTEDLKKNLRVKVK